MSSGIENMFTEPDSISWNASDLSLSEYALAQRARSRRMIEEEGETHRRVNELQRLYSYQGLQPAENNLPIDAAGYLLRQSMEPLDVTAERSDLYSRRTKRRQTDRSFWDMVDQSFEDREPFNVYQALLSHQELVLELAKQLEVDDLLNLYSISKPFNQTVNRQYTAVMLGNARVHAPESARVFGFKAYRNLCIYDPNRMVNQEVLTQENKRQVRDVPGFKWLRMVTFREEVVDSIILEMAEAGHRLPYQCSVALKKIWFLMDVPDTKRRIGIIHNPELWTNKDLFYATLFFIKLDMRVTDPLDGSARPVLRHIILAQRSLSVLNGVLLRELMRNPYELLQMFVQTQVAPNVAPPQQQPVQQPPAQQPPVQQGQQGPMLANQVPLMPLPVNQMPINIQQQGQGHIHGALHDSSMFGVPRNQVGMLSRQDWSTDGNPWAHPFLLRPDELVMREAIRRDLRLEKWYLDMLLWGYINPKTGRDVWPPSVEKRMREEGVPAPEPSYDRQQALRGKKDAGGSAIGDPSFDIFAEPETEEEEDHDAEDESKGKGKGANFGAAAVGEVEFADADADITDEGGAEADVEDNAEDEIEDDDEIEVEDNAEIEIEDDDEIPIDDNAEIEIEDNDDTEIEEDNEIEIGEDDEIDIEEANETEIGEDDDIEIEEDNQIEIEEGDDEEQIEIKDDNEIELGEEDEDQIEDNDEFQIEDDEVEIEEDDESDIEDNDEIPIEDEEIEIDEDDEIEIVEDDKIETGE